MTGKDTACDRGWKHEDDDDGAFWRLLPLTVKGEAVPMLVIEIMICHCPIQSTSDKLGSHLQPQLPTTQKVSKSSSTTPHDNTT